MADENRTPKEDALVDVREALASLNMVPGAPLDEQKHEKLRSAVDDVSALERELTHEVEQESESDVGQK